MPATRRLAGTITGHSRALVVQRARRVEVIRQDSELRQVSSRVATGHPVCIIMANRCKPLPRRGAIGGSRDPCCLPPARLGRPGCIEVEPAAFASATRADTADGQAGSARAQTFMTVRNQRPCRRLQRCGSRQWSCRSHRGGHGAREQRPRVVPRRLFSASAHAAGLDQGRADPADER